MSKMRRGMSAFLRSLADGIDSQGSFEKSMAAAGKILSSQGFGASDDPRVNGELAFISSLAIQAPTLIDVGAHVGDYTQMFLECHPSAVVYCFEPVAAHFRALANRFVGNPNVRLFQKALGCTAGSATIYRDAEISGLASLSRRRLDHFGISLERQETVEVTTLDRICEELGIDRVDLLKIDAEGHDLFVLKGGKETLTKGNAKNIQFEFGGANLDTHTTLQDFFYLLEGLGYDLNIVQPKGLCRLKRYSELYEQYRYSNFVATLR